MKDALSAQPLPVRTLLWLALLLGFAVTPHFWHLSPLITAFFFAMCSWRLLGLWQPRWLPGRLTIFMLMLLGLANVLLNGGVSDGRRGGVSLLVAMLGLKLLEVRSRRDVYISVFLGYFIGVTQFLFDQQFFITFYVALLVLGLTALLVQLNRLDADRPLKTSLRESGLLLATAIPAMLVLFLLFPRLGGPLWSIGFDAGTAFTGVSDRITSGSISRLSQSRRVAFRVEFPYAGPPPPNLRYWRGPVLWHTDGRTWTGIRRPRAAAPTLQTRGPPLRYQMTLEPTQRRWLFALDLTSRTPANATLTADYELLWHQPVRERMTYEADAQTDYLFNELGAEERALGLQLPPNVTDRMRGLVERWRGESARPGDIVLRALAHFREQPYVYTLTPPLLGANPADEFLFETRRGFCEHFATSFALLMRIAGIPTRLVAGYQGGEINPHGDHLIVRQSDAHVWNEVWLDGLGWQRIDPTGAVAPERIEQSIQVDEQTDGAAVTFEVSDGLLRQIWLNASWFVDSVQLGWHRWIVNYDPHRQQRLLDRLGLGGLGDYGQALVTVLAAFLALGLGATLLLIKGRLQRGDRLQTAYRQLQDKLRRNGVELPPWLGPLDARSRALARHPGQAARLAPLFDAYIALRYGRLRARYGRLGVRALERRFVNGVRRLKLAGAGHG